MGDYHILTGNYWEAALVYMQVDKDFREDMLGEEARFRNAKLSYYQGDFEWAQGQLTVLKQSTSELIANDALYLSVLMIENVAPDSNMVPIKRFAHADLLMFQNKDAQAEALLDSINKAFPEHPLKDDILLQRSRIALKHRDYIKALGYLKEIYEKHADDVLGDDAVFKTADIYENYLHQKDEATKFYEKLIINYPGSTYVQTARKQLNNLKSEGAPAP
jgi:tetratricopeptide (TPR) repeat protein